MTVDAVFVIEREIVLVVFTAVTAAEGRFNSVA